MGVWNGNILMVLLCMCCIVLLFFTDVLFNAGTMILTSGLTDTATQFVYFREFAFAEMRKGNLALWNPYLFSGTPFMGGFQSALIYPFNVIFLFLPVTSAINLSVIIHLVMLGFFMFIWALKSGFNRLAAFLSAILIIFSGAYFPHIYAGHLPNICAMAWVPLIFLCLDRLTANPQWKWVLIGIAAVAMQILAGHPQYVYYTVMVSAFYAVLKLLLSNQGGNRALSFFTVISMFAGAVLLCAIQILVGLEASEESIRAGGVPYHFAAMFSLPPENLLTLLVPNLFGDLLFHPYWGRTYYWESNLFLSIGGFTLAFYAFLRRKKTERVVGIATLICVVLSLGVHTPLFDFLYRYFPGFNQFRGTAKFSFFVVLFLSFLAGKGLHFLIHDSEGKIERKVVISLLSCSVLASIIAGILYLAEGNEYLLHWWNVFLRFVANSGETYLPKGLYYEKKFATWTASLAGSQFLLVAGVFLLTAVAWRLNLRRKGNFIYLLVVLAALEVLVFAGMTRTSFDVKESLPEGLVKFLSGLDKNGRVLNLWRPNMALTTRTCDIWGYDPGVGKRYTEFITFTQGGDPNQASQYVNFNRYHPLLKLTRLRYIIIPTREGIKVQEVRDCMTHASFIYDWRYEKEKEKILEIMGKDDFNPRKTAVVESPLSIKPETCPFPGKVETKTLDTDTMIIEAETKCPGLILITDNYAKGWRAHSMISERERYNVLRADYTFMAIPVNAGYHKIRLEYLPQSFVIGRWISLFGLVIYIGLWGWMLKKKFI